MITQLLGRWSKVQGTMGDFKRLTVWRLAQANAVEVYRWTRGFPVAERFGLQAQLRRAAVSIAANIAEGSGRGADRQLVQFLRIARGSTAELECELMVSRDIKILPVDHCRVLLQTTRRINRLLLGLIRRLESSSVS